MKILRILLFFCCVLSFAPQSLAQAEAPTLLVVVFGDELTSNSYLPSSQSYPAQLEKKLKDIGFSVRVENRSMTDKLSEEFLNQTPSIIAQSPDAVIIQAGEADVRRGINPRSVIGNIKAIVRELKAKSIYPIVMGFKVPSTREPEYAWDIDQGLKEIAGGTQLYPSTLGEINGNPELTIGDGYRPNSKGVAVMVESTYRFVDAGLRWRLEVIKRIMLQKQKQAN